MVQKTRRSKLALQLAVTGFVSSGALAALGALLAHEQALPPAGRFAWAIVCVGLVLGGALAVLVAREERLRSSLREKEILLKEIHHRVKNNLQIISSLLNLECRRLEDPAARRALRASQTRVQSVALVHEKLYESRSLAGIGAVDFIQSLTTALLQSYGADPNLVRLTILSDQVDLAIDTAIPCGLLLNELVSNALKHAFPPGKQGQIVVEFRSRGKGRLHLRVSDDGVGLPPDFDYRNPASLGLQLVNSLAEQLDGTLRLTSGAGTTFEVTFGEPEHSARL